MSVWFGTLGALLLTLLAFLAGERLYRLSGRLALLHPTIAGAVLTAAALHLLEVDYDQYMRGNETLQFLLGPATVALAVPLYYQLHLVRGLVAPLLITVVAGAAFAALSALGIAWWLGANPQTLLSLASKSVTTPIAIGISEEIGGLMTVTTGAVVFTGAAGIVLAPPLLRWLRVDDPRLWGFCMGLAAHGVGTARAFEINSTAGAFASLGLCLTGTLSAVIIPLAVTAGRFFG